MKYDEMPPNCLCEVCNNHGVPERRFAEVEDALLERHERGGSEEGRMRRIPEFADETLEKLLQSHGVALRRHAQCSVVNLHKMSN